jgi:ABC-type multidrug transport system ATPase subunit
MGLRDLRRRIAVLPQEPTLFDGTVRSNLDPFDQRTDEEIWGALRAAHLADKIKSMPLRLDATIIENGKGFSLGQKQLFCIARAILSRCRILLMDEATSALDIQTETMINETIHKNFASYTVLQIGHRLNTIIDSDKIMVMDQGRIVEFDTPRRLLQNENSFFTSLVAQSGEEAAKKLREKVFSSKGSRDRMREDDDFDEPEEHVTDTSELSQRPFLTVNNDAANAEPLQRQASHRSQRTETRSEESTIIATAEAKDAAKVSLPLNKSSQGLSLHANTATRSITSLDSARSSQSNNKNRSTAINTPSSINISTPTEMPLSLGSVFSPPTADDENTGETSEAANRSGDVSTATTSGPVSRKSNASDTGAT